MKRVKGQLYLLLLLLGVPLLVWQLAIAKTWRFHRQTKQEQAQIADMNSVPAEKHNAATLDTEEYLQSGLILERIMPEAEKYGASIIKYSPIVTADDGGIVLRTAELNISASFHAIVRIVNYIQSDMLSCRIVSVNFRTVRQNRTQRLVAQIVVQQIVTL